MLNESVLKKESSDKKKSYAKMKPMKQDQTNWDQINRDKER